MEIISNHCLGVQNGRIDLQSRQVVRKRQPECPEGGSTAPKARPQQSLMTSQETPWDPFGHPGLVGHQNNTIGTILKEKRVTKQDRTRK